MDNYPVLFILLCVLCSLCVFLLWSGKSLCFQNKSLHHNLVCFFLSN